MIATLNDVGNFSFDRLDPAFQVVFACCRNDESSRHVLASILDGSADSIDWSRVIEYARNHRVLPLVCRQLRQQHVSRYVPTGSAHEFEKVASALVRRNLWMTSWLLRINQLMKEHDIPLISFKGPALAQRLYGDFALRQSADLDFFVRLRDVDRASLLLASLQLRPVFELDSRQQSVIRKNECEIVLTDGNDLLVELHWNVLPRNYRVPLSMDDLWSRSVPVEFVGEQLRDLTPEDLLLVLSLHANKHSWGSLCWICDIARLITIHPGLDWELVFERARAIHAERIVLIGPFLANLFMGTELIEPLAGKCSREKALSSIAQRILRRMDKVRLVDEESLSTFLFFLRSRERWRDRFGQLLSRAIIPGVAEVRGRVVPFPLYAPLRLSRILRAFILRWTR